MGQVLVILPPTVVMKAISCLMDTLLEGVQKILSGLEMLESANVRIKTSIVCTI